MKAFSALLINRNVRPFTILVTVTALLSLLDRGTGYFFSIATVFSVLQLFGTLGLVALGLGLTMQVREFDLSVAGVFSLSGCVAVLTGAQNPWIGLACGVTTGLAAGAIQGLLITYLRLSSVGVTLGGLLTLQGLSYVLTGNRSVAYPKIELALALNQPVFGVLSIRSVGVLIIFFIAAFVMAYTRVGRDVIATGGDKRAAMMAGVNTDGVIIGVFTASGGAAALGGVLLSYGLGAASPAGLSDVLAPAAAAAIIGGVSLAGGTGRPLGIAAGVLILCALRSGLGAIGVSPHVHDILTGMILLIIGILDAPALMHRVMAWKLSWIETREVEKTS